MPETGLEQLIRRNVRQQWLTAQEAYALTAACEMAAECNANIPEGNEFIDRYGRRTAATLARMLKPLEATDGRSQAEDPPNSQPPTA